MGAAQQISQLEVFFPTMTNQSLAQSLGPYRLCSADVHSTVAILQLDPFTLWLHSLTYASHSLVGTTSPSSSSSSVGELGLFRMMYFLPLPVVLALLLARLGPRPTHGLAHDTRRVGTCLPLSFPPTLYVYETMQGDIRRRRPIQHTDAPVVAAFMTSGRNPGR